MQKTSKTAKRHLQKALQERLALLTASLSEAEVGGKGIELVKEMKELYAMLDAADETVQAARKQEPQEIRIMWAVPQQEHIPDSKERKA